MSLAELQAQLKEATQKVSKLRDAIDSYTAPGERKKILVLGAGRSSTSCINYLLDRAKEGNWTVKVGDIDENAAKKKVEKAPEFGVGFKLTSNEQREQEISTSDVVVSLLPPHMHDLVAKDCVKHGKNMVTASYVSDGVRALDAQAKEAGVLLMMECGVDPGIDHMGASKVLDKIRKRGGELNTFQSFTGGLVAPESDNNPWNYKLTWNPRNVVLAGQGISKFIHNGELKYIPYHQLFSRYEDIQVEGHGLFEGIANRDSLHYRDIYDLHNCPTVFRGTLRKPGFCKAWNVFVKLGMTDDTYEMEGTDTMTYRDFLNSFLVYREHDSVELKVCYHLGLSCDGPPMKKLKWLGMFDARPIGFPKKRGTPAQVLQHILEKKWQFVEGDKDMIVMWNQFVFEDAKSQANEIITSMVCKGDGTFTGTAMANTVGWPVGIVTKLVVQNKLKHLSGVHIPKLPEIYNPVLDELENFGVRFVETESVVPSSYLALHA
eukprot:CAMPEP_0174252446 /NCGR_PEP_ID=MMETSP0439-20130205/1912_1 /TAXON_ID=0 /ORGANISM="Stereomyxa ramosa, Strain Chinc5" /LENGTH=489 /DNA_ID=CAMNT_0015332981 /DNA_START=107 /DNA_END=1576 /DNA_ORIENTATION=-